MITGTHIVISSTDAEADRKFLAKVFKLPSVDAGKGWLIFGLPPSELAIHPAKHNNEHEFYMMCKDIEAFVKTMKTKKVPCTKPKDHGWGILAEITLPGGGKIGVYEPRHPQPH